MGEYCDGVLYERDSKLFFSLSLKSTLWDCIY